MKDAEYWIRELGLMEHPEGGYFRETYRSEEFILQHALPERFGEKRSFSTAIYFLLRGYQVSHLHRIQSDELWHFYAGSSLTIHMIHPDGKYEEKRLGPDTDRGDLFQVLVPYGSWFGASVNIQENYSLMGCTVAPGFDFADFEMGDRAALLAQYPEHASLVRKLT